MSALLEAVPEALVVLAVLRELEVQVQVVPDAVLAAVVRAAAEVVPLVQVETVPLGLVAIDLLVQAEIVLPELVAIAHLAVALPVQAEALVATAVVQVELAREQAQGPEPVPQAQERGLALAQGPELLAEPALAELVEETVLVVAGKIVVVVAEAVADVAVVADVAA